MKLQGRNRLKEFTKQYPQAKKWINNWISDVENADWQTTQDIKNRYPSVSFLSNNIVVFNVKGNHYRLEAQIAYRAKIVVVKWVGTHVEYDKRNKQR